MGKSDVACTALHGWCKFMMVQELLNVENNLVDDGMNLCKVLLRILYFFQAPESILIRVPMPSCIQSELTKIYQSLTCKLLSIPNYNTNRIHRINIVIYNLYTTCTHILYLLLQLSLLFN